LAALDEDRGLYNVQMRIPPNGDFNGQAKLQSVDFFP